MENINKFLNSLSTLSCSNLEMLMDTQSTYHYNVFEESDAFAHVRPLTSSSELVEHKGGTDQGSEYWSVWKFTLFTGETIFVKFEGWYASYQGSDFERFYQVVGKEVTKIEWSKPDVDTYTTNSYGYYIHNSYESSSY